MKRVFIYFVTAAVMFIAWACDKGIAPIVDSDRQQGTLRAVWADASESRTVVQSDGTTVMWSGEEHIKVFFSPNYEADFVSSRYGTRKETEFIGPFPKETNEEFKPFYPEIWALYPFDDAAVCDGESICFHIPSRQEAKIGSFADNLFPAIGKTASPDEPLTFYNVCGGACFCVTEDGIGMITFKALGGESLTGTIKVGFDASGKPEVSDILEGYDSVIVMAPEGGFSPGKVYYVAFIPQKLSSGLSITLQRGRSVAERRIDRSIVVTRSRFGRLDGVDEGLKYVEDTSEPNPLDIILFADARMKEDCVAAFDTNGDGELSYQEAAEVTSLTGVFNSKLYTYFEEFRYFTGIREIPDAFFQDWALLKRIDLPEGVVSIGAKAFWGCRSLKSLSFPKTLISIGKFAFRDCISLTELSIGSLTQWLDLKFPSIGINTMEYIETFPLEASRGGHLLIAGEELTSVSIPEQYTSIREYAFAGCQSITDVTLPSATKSIGVNAFGLCINLTRVHVPSVQYWLELDLRCSLFHSEGHIIVSGEEIKEIVIPESVTQLGNYAFRYCTGLEAIIMEPIIPPTIGSYTFYGTTCPIYVWDVSIDYYLSDSNWKEYWKQLRINPNSP